MKRVLKQQKRRTMKNKKLVRTCIGCRTKKNKSELIRIIKNKDSEVLIDFNQCLKR